MEQAGLPSTDDTLARHEVGQILDKKIKTKEPVMIKQKHCAPETKVPIVGPFTGRGTPHTSGEKLTRRISRGEGRREVPFLRLLLNEQ
jgi:hypothetical protein